MRKILIIFILLTAAFGYTLSSDTVVVIDTVVAIDTACQASALDSIVQTEDTSIILKNGVTPVNQTLGDEKICWITKWFLYWDQNKESIIFFLIFVSFLIALITLKICKYIAKKNNTYEEICTTIIKIILCLFLSLICVFSNSSWAYLVLIALTLLLFDKYIPLNRLSEIVSLLQGQPKISPQTAEEKKERAEKEIIQDSKIDQNTQQSASNRKVQDKKDKAQRKMSIDDRVQKYIKIEQESLNFLEKKYPKLQRNVRIRGSKLQKFELDGLVIGNNGNRIIEIKYCISSNLQVLYHSLYNLKGACEYLSISTRKSTEILLFIVTKNKEVKNIIERDFNKILYEQIDFQILTEKELNDRLK